MATGSQKFITKVETEAEWSEQVERAPASTLCVCDVYAKWSGLAQRSESACPTSLAITSSAWPFHLATSLRDAVQPVVSRASQPRPYSSAPMPCLTCVRVCVFVCAAAVMTSNGWRLALRASRNLRCSAASRSRCSCCSGAAWSLTAWPTAPMVSSWRDWSKSTKAKRSRSSSVCVGAGHRVSWAQELESAVRMCVCNNLARATCGFVGWRTWYTASSNSIINK